jgi:acetyl esterase/lipase
MGTLPNVTFDPAKGLKLDVYRPDAPGLYPLGVCVHGGGFDAGDKSQQKAICLDAMSAGPYTMIAPNYTLAQPGSFWPNQLADVKKALDYALDPVRSAQWRIDPARVFLIGTSAGGQIVSMAAAGNAWGVKAVASLSGVMDFPMLVDPSGSGDSRYPTWASSCDALFGTGSWTSSDPRLVAASPVSQVATTNAPELVANSLSEDIPIEQARAMVLGLQNAGVDCDPKEYVGTAHGVKLWPAARADVLAFLAARV